MVSNVVTLNTFNTSAVFTITIPSLSKSDYFEI